jgi:hypothetical protein
MWISRRWLPPFVDVIALSNVLASTGTRRTFSGNNFGLKIIWQIALISATASPADGIDGIKLHGLALRFEAERILGGNDRRFLSHPLTVRWSDQEQTKLMAVFD